MDVSRLELPVGHRRGARDRATARSAPSSWCRPAWRASARSSRRCRPGSTSTRRTRWRRRARATSTAPKAGRSGRCTACRWASRTSSTPPTCPPRTAPCCTPAARPTATPRWWRMLRAAGAVILGKTVTTECATYPPGKTRNPHDPDAHARRLVVRLGGGGGGRHGAAGARHADQRVGHPAGGVLRRLRLQADARTDPAPRHPQAVALARLRGRVRAHARRHRAGSPSS